MLYVPKFKYNLLSIHKIASEMIVIFSSILRSVSFLAQKVLANGTMKQGLYYLDLNKSLDVFMVNSHENMKNYSMWYSRLGHAPIAKLNSVAALPHMSADVSVIAHTYPMTRFTKLPFSLSESHTNIDFALLYIDILRTYRVSVKGKYKYFLTLIDDGSRMTSSHFLTMLNIITMQLLEQTMLWSLVIHFINYATVIKKLFIKSLVLIKHKKIQG